MDVLDGDPNLNRGQRDTIRTMYEQFAHRARAEASPLKASPWRLSASPGWEVCRGTFPRRPRLPRRRLLLRGPWSTAFV